MKVKILVTLIVLNVCIKQVIQIILKRSFIFCYLGILDIIGLCTDELHMWIFFPSLSFY
jgi:hypothetical protein